MSNLTDLPRLSAATIAALPISVRRPTYDREAVTPGIVHLGIGAFCRAHLGVYTDEVLATGVKDWGIVGVDLLALDMRAALKPQDCLYTKLERIAGEDRLQVIGSFLDILTTIDQETEVLALMCRPDIRIITITVTEKGYCQDAATGTLDETHPAIRADLENPRTPKTVPGLLTEAIRRRREQGVPAFTVLSCDNLAQNGVTARRIVTRFAELVDPDLGGFVAATIAFPCTMVDRITPATRDAERDAVKAGLGLVDAWPVVTEPFRQWVIEDNFPTGRPAWEKAGAILTDDVHPFETMKLRCLNGAHSLLAYLSVLLGIETVAEAMADPHLPRVIRRLWDEDLIATVPPVPGTDVTAYTHDLEGRFVNPEIRHLTIQISSDGSQKLGPRWLEAAGEILAEGGCPKVIPLGVAAWALFLLRSDGNGRTWGVADPIAERLTAIAAANAHSAAALVDGLLAVREIFPEGVAANPAFHAAVVARVEAIRRFGARGAIEAFLAE
ncbi:mannitol dehydrogenase family protein [Siculibacillus lacustris]|uniref:Mannitol dehydrogenase family protein n=1 Tax=Siculibacillus lacustris TaxID=1549641 RepID=A0A4Q9VUZ5_9HYPH|nr:mannitol dehydrogenase family protein [Siculibacillus lacustris]TBW40055.1 mannitol dehydrogenase family protein [Siculibacillus lacustris]